MYQFTKHDEEAKRKSIIFQPQQSISEAATNEYKDQLNEFTSSILKLNLKQKDQDAVFKLSTGLIESYRKVNEVWSTVYGPAESLEVTTDIFRQHIQKYKSKYQRNKNFNSKERFVMPVEKAIGTRWELKRVKNLANRFIRVPRLIQCTMQYAPILNTLKSLFLCEEFYDMYFKYNESDRSNCAGLDGTKNYTCFSSGSVFASTDFFKSNPTCLQLQIGVDDFEVCNPLQSKSNHHKICAVYFSIHNLPAKFQSKLNNIYLVCLCNTDDLKSKQTDINNIWQLIRDEILDLEENGIHVRGGRNVKGTLVHAVFDNLGANVGLGFSGGFNSKKYCRFCLSYKTQCETITRESECALRTIENYERSLDTIDNSEKVNYEETDGVKFYCVLSDLNHFHIIQNATVDAMHDLNEGCIPRFLSNFFKFCFKNKIFSRDELENLAKFYDYGTLDSSNVPSRIDLEKKSLGQNAAQSMCLFRHLPFILIKWKDHPKLKEVWECYGALLFICEVAYSYEITETELKKFEEAVDTHLKLFQKIFQVSLSPKQHFLIHYATVIRAVGPTIFYNMFRFDSKHKVFKNFRYATNNFKAINKSLALQHQKQILINGFSYKDNIEWGMVKDLDHPITLHLSALEKLDQITEPLVETKFLHFNNYKYVKGMMIVNDGRFHEICYILYVSQAFYFICKQYVTTEFDTFLNSFNVHEESNELYLVAFTDHAKSYELKRVHGKNYIISSSRDLHKQIKM